MLIRIANCKSLFLNFIPLFFSFAISIVFLQSCQFQDRSQSDLATDKNLELSSEQEEALADTLLTHAKQFNATWNEMDSDSILSYVSNDLHYFWGGTTMSSREEFSHVLQKFITPNAQTYSSEMLNTRVEVLGPNAGVVSFEFRGEAVNPNGETRNISGVVTYVLERRNSNWKIIHMHESGPLSE